MIERERGIDPVPELAPERPPPARTVHRRPTVQLKLLVGAVDDPAEREADQVAEQVLARLSGAPSEPQTVHRAPPRIRRLAADEVNHGPEGGAIDPQVASRITARQGGGAPLSEPTRARFEHAFDADLSAVRIHTGTEADQLNRSLNARAFTAGRDIFFSQGTFAPGSSEGNRVLAHELTHAVQQGAAAQRTPRG